MPTAQEARKRSSKSAREAAYSVRGESTPARAAQVAAPARADCPAKTERLLLWHARADEALP